MTAVTVKRFAEQIGVSEERLLQQLKNAGVLDKTIDGDLDGAEEVSKERLSGDLGDAIRLRYIHIQGKIAFWRTM